MTTNKAWDWRTESQRDWNFTEGKPDQPELFSALAVGCLQRIANSLETLVDRSDPERIRQRAEMEDCRRKREECWALFSPFSEKAHDAHDRAMDRLFAGKKAKASIKDAVGYVYNKGSPDQPYSWGILSQFNPVVAEQWLKDTLAYWDGVKELPLQIAGSETKKQANYAKWLEELGSG